MPKEPLSFDDYAKSSLFQHLVDINSFHLLAEVPPLGRRIDPVRIDAIVSRMFEHLRGVVKGAGFFHDYELETSEEPGRFGVEYKDDRFDFSVNITDDRISLVRRGSRLRNFHKWYNALMPSASGIIEATGHILSEELKRKVEVLRSAFQFRFVIYDIEPEGAAKPVSNSVIMRKLLRGFPDDTGEMSEADHVLATMGRADVNIARWTTTPGHKRRLLYKVEAPGNLELSSLWFTFEYTGESFTSPDGVREDFEAASFLTEYDEAYTGFLRDKALGQFMSTLLRGYRFKSTPAALP